MGIFRKVHGVTIRSKVRSYEIREALNVELLLRMERSQQLCFVHETRMPSSRKDRRDKS